MPTRYGYGYAVLLLAMLLGAMNYSNSLIFATTFLLAAIGLLAMHQTHGNLVNLVVHRAPVASVHAGEPARFRLRLENPSKLPRYALSAHWQDRPPAAYVDLRAGTDALLELPLETDRRGWLPAPRFAVVTEFPFGLFHAWTWVELDQQALVYPRLAAPGLMPPAGRGGRGQATGGRPGEDEFAGLRSYRPGDPLRSVHWKAMARLGQPYVKLFVEEQAEQRWLDWAQLPPSWGTEARLSQLARWVLDAETAGEPYGLRLPGLSLAPALGPAHRHACLAALARFGL